MWLTKSESIVRLEAITGIIRHRTYLSHKIGGKEHGKEDYETSCFLLLSGDASRYPIWARSLVLIIGDLLMTSQK